MKKERVFPVYDGVLDFRPATRGDLLFLMDLREKTMREHIERTGLRYDPQVQKEFVLEAFEHAQILMREGQPIGLFKLNRTTSPWKLMQVQIMPAMQGQGIGSRLLHQIVSAANAAGQGVVLDVLKQNPAKKMYERAGFKTIHEDEYFYYLSTHSLT